jgi:hypothetical protein
MWLSTIGQARRGVVSELTWASDAFNNNKRQINLFKYALELWVLIVNEAILIFNLCPRVPNELFM